MTTPIDWAPDISYYQKDLTPVQRTLMIQRGVAAVIFKAGQNNWEDSAAVTHHAWAVEESLPYAIYFWPDPIYAMQPQVDRLNALIDKFNPASVIIDVEQWWSDWQKWWDVIIKKLPGTVPTFTPAQLRTFYRNFGQAMRPKTNAKGIKLGMYSARWFDNYIQGLSSLMNTNGGPYQFYHHAQYMSWQDSDGDGKMSIQEFNDRVATLPEPTLPNGISEAEVWQVSSSFPYPGLPNLDTNVLTQEGWQMVFGVDVEEVPPEGPPGDEDPPVDELQLPATLVPLKKVKVKSGVTWLNIRSKPRVLTADTDIGDMGAGTVLPVLKVDGEWGFVGGWIHLGYTQDV